nr:hypothetical protein [Marinicella sp. W31]MDC2876025.1 hypothetical protein [Marinicella sp. W31]
MAYGKLMVTGTVKEVVAASNLESYLITGAHVHELQAELETAEGVDLVAPFGSSLHVCGHDRAALERAIQPYRDRPDTQCRPGEATLEDAFIYMMNASKDNFNDG